MPPHTAVAPDEHQLQAWLDGRAAPPDAQMLAAYARSLGTRRLAARAEAADCGKRLKLLVPLLYRAGVIHTKDLAQESGFGLMTVAKALNEAGIVHTGRVDVKAGEPRQDAGD